MTDLILSAARSRATEIRRTKLKRFKLVFIQLGAGFQVLREPLLDALGGTRLNAAEFAATTDPIEPTGPVVLDNLEAFAYDGKAGGTTLGALRERVNALRDEDIDVCLVSRSPKIAFAPVAGSNLLADASWHCLPLLGPHECGEEAPQSASLLPTVGLGDQPDVKLLLRQTLSELGVNVLTELDFALFEAGHQAGFITEIEPDVAEALRGAGLARVVDGAVTFVAPGPFWMFRNAVADVIAATVGPQADLPAVAEGLWLIERTIRRVLRDAALAASDAKWRKNLFNESIAAKVLERARHDVNVTAISISDLRDPIEWLSLGELLEVVQSRRFNGLSWDELNWKHFAQDILPIRNRLSHMRLLKKGDRAKVGMWVNRVRTTLF
ncbi:MULTISPECIES: hypothetical protein [unclassified Amycolatopsis]|uniref:hypothetical protein n=1 Tax=unclassified Amycolatopsis TaxID=2618356 RepID=UPI0028768BA0|nr:MULTISPECIES: hypothetical protein [unclassified Amycolatopsis]MDS0135768.1 hypothetical protein [Amycolatopsis sp. 505]MDS0145631.1 hypothetical protein [Amycolatopsis sp. CM201R]